MENNKFNFCPDCGSKKIQTLFSGRQWKCPECGLVLFNNVASAVGVIIENEKHEVLLERRAKEPRRNFLAFPGGFCEPDEEAEKSAVRECMEEIGVAPEKLSFVGAFPNTYEYKGILYKTCDMFFSAVLPASFVLKMQPSEVVSLEWIPASSMEEIEKIPFAFESARKALARYRGEK
ncbi:NUDIX domain-containing protein [Treponema sp.]|uniref:NUDIX hydrolase n=1 Tax=Treponema sp. TaxID=166 RepID=UPI003F0E85E6